MHAVLRRALADAVRDELVSRNVSLLVSPGKAPRPRVVPVTDIEARALLAAAADDRLRVLWLVLLSLGLRRGEALALRWSAVDLDGGTLEVRASLQRRRTNEVTPSGRRRSTLIEVDPKTEGSVRTLALPDVLVEALRQQRRVQTAERLAARTWVDAGLVFTTSVGTALEPRNVSRSWERVCERAGLDRHLRIHNLRHAAASFLLLQGADLRTVMEQLGHSRLATTSDVYVHVLDRLTTQEAADLLGVSRPTLVKLLESGAIPFECPGRHRRVRLEDLLRYQKRQAEARRTGLKRLTQEAQETGLYDIGAEEYDEALDHVRHHKG